MNKWREKMLKNIDKKNSIRCLKLNSFLLSSLFFLIQILRGQTLYDISSTQHFYSKEVVEPNIIFFFWCFSWQNEFSHRPPFQNFLINRWKVYFVELQVDLFPSLKISIGESTYPSQYPQYSSLSQHFLLPSDLQICWGWPDKGSGYLQIR